MINMKSKKVISISAIAVVVFSLIFGAIYFNTHYAIINGEIYKNDITEIHPYLDITDIEEINKCNKIETMFLSKVSKNAISRLKNFHNLNFLSILNSEVDSVDSEKINKFNNLEYLIITKTAIDFKGFNNNAVSTMLLGLSEITNIIELSKCKSLRSIVIQNSIINDCIINKGSYILENSSVFSSLDNVTKLTIVVDEIQDISGILEMDSLKEFKVNKDSISEEDVKLLEDKGISVIYCDENE